LLSWRQLEPYIGAMGRATIWRMVKRGEFPKAVRLSPGRVAWREVELVAWQAQRRAA